MLRVALLLLALITPTLVVAQSSEAQTTLSVLPSKYSVEETVTRLVKEIEAKGLKVAARIDHAAGAKAAGLEMPPTVVVLFGNPKLGTPLMLENPQLGIDLPMRIIVWQDKAGKVSIGYTPPATLQARYAIKTGDNVTVLKTMAGALEAFAKAAAN
ncbi:MAG: DUF302 domain-containing protein [Hyphomicrobiaceae bacterium]